jgi:hypothetical protein
MEFEMLMQLSADMPWSENGAMAQVKRHDSCTGNPG